MTYQFHNKEFAKMMFDPTKLPDGEEVLKYFKDLYKHKEFRINPGEGIDNNKLLLYIMCVYDANSPYRKKFPDILKRKIEACHDCGFKMKEEGKFTEPTEDFLRGNNDKVNRKIVEFVRMHRNFKYSYLVTIESSYYSMIYEIINGNTKLISEARNVQTELEETLMELLNLDDNPRIRDELLRYMENERLNLRPEDVALNLREKKKPV